MHNYSHQNDDLGPAYFDALNYGLDVSPHQWARAKHVLEPALYLNPEAARTWFDYWAYNTVLLAPDEPRALSPCGKHELVDPREFGPLNGLSVNTATGVLRLCELAEGRPYLFRPGQQRYAMTRPFQPFKLFEDDTEQACHWLGIRHYSSSSIDTLQ